MPRPLSTNLLFLLALLAVTSIAVAAGRLYPVIGAPVIAIVLGVAVGPLVVHRRPDQPTLLGFAKDRVLQLAVVAFGAQLSLRQLADVGVGSLPVMLGTLTVCLVAAQLIGRRLGIARDLRLLIGAGTGICGASAIAAVSSTIRPRQEQVGYAISTIFLFNVAAVLVFPVLGHALGMSPQNFGLFAGTAVNDTSSVIAAAQTFGGGAEQHAVVVKLVRTLMIVPICLTIATRRRAENADGAAGGSGRDGRIRSTVALVPGFLVAFVVVVALNSLGALPVPARSALTHAAPVLVVVALAAIGASVDVRRLRGTGARPLLLGLLLWALVTVTSLGLQGLTA